MVFHAKKTLGAIFDRNYTLTPIKCKCVRLCVRVRVRACVRVCVCV